MMFEGSNMNLGVFTLIYSLLGFLGYFGFAEAPILKAIHSNAAPLAIGGSTAIVMAGQ